MASDLFCPGNTIRFAVVVGKGAVERSIGNAVRLDHPGLKVTQVTATAVAISAVVLSDKVLVQSQIHVDALYITADNDVAHTSYTVPASAVIPVVGAQPGMKPYAWIDAEVLSSEITAGNILKQELALTFIAEADTECVQGYCPCNGLLWERPYPRFESHVEGPFMSTDTYKASRSYDISRQTLVTFLVHNTGNLNPVTCQLEISPNQVLWIQDGPEYIVQPGTATPIVPRVFLQYARVKFRSTLCGQSTSVAVWSQFQA